ncbi:O-antigen biosynthesis protein WbqP [Rhizobium skierniewicense]|uniref:O-antigen biosynthesis protein WbqP n=1 Tax=Rhizobium skierniewicense TaxID=984260 RepID=A0A7W6C2J5_9HYPH|nr:sugar transferase [Rhizobium skierniewicense]MBB3944592.1 O-antigen biosynthesis protein WbqP [Rhizobium skierniewicense]
MADRVNSVIKRFFDIIASAGGLIVFSPLLLVLVILIRRDSPGGAFFLQQRVGRHERIFTCIKFRTMAAGTPNVGSHNAQQSWITPLGKKIRSIKLDELPQLINVLKGDMSLVGPRPCLPSQSEVIEARRERNVFSVRPGVTGLAQVSGVDMSTPEQLAAIDASYISNASFSGDMRLIVATAFNGARGDAAAK